MVVPSIGRIAEPCQVGYI